MLLLTRKISGKIAVLGLSMLLLSLWQALEGAGIPFGALRNDKEFRFEIVKVEEAFQVSFKRPLPAITARLGMEREEPVGYCDINQVSLPSISRCLNSQANRDPPRLA